MEATKQGQYTDTPGERADLPEANTGDYRFVPKAA
jgi:hypothetical protein